jgi:hypothetical protein
MTRILVYVCGVLIIANVAALFWPDKTRVGLQVYSEKAAISPHFIRLNKEIEDQYFMAQESSSKQAVAASIAVNEPTSVKQTDCYRIGPFMHQANFDLAEAVLLNAGVDYRKSTRASVKSDVFRVYLGPYLSLAKASDVRDELKRNNILDQFIRQEDEQRYIISLGIYSVQESADNAVQLFSNRLNSVNLKKEVVMLPESFWLHFAIENESQIKQQLASMDWGEQSAKSGRHKCREEGTPSF